MQLVSVTKQNKHAFGSYSKTKIKSLRFVYKGWYKASKLYFIFNYLIIICKDKNVIYKGKNNKLFKVNSQSVSQKDVRI